MENNTYPFPFAAPLRIRPDLHVSAKFAVLSMTFKDFSRSSPSVVPPVDSVETCQTERWKPKHFPALFLRLRTDGTIGLGNDDILRSVLPAGPGGPDRARLCFTSN